MAADWVRPVRDTAVVDLACGTGSAALVAAEAGVRVTAVDLTAELIAIAAETPRDRMRCAGWWPMPRTPAYPTSGAIQRSSVPV
jgi:hypothetical protein